MINLFINWFDHPDLSRRAELETCLQKNIENEHIDNIIKVNVGQRASYNQLFKATHQYPEDINIIANLDIYFDDTIKLVEAIKQNECYALSRWEYQHGVIKLHGDGNPLRLGWSQDVWIFRGAVPELAVYNGRAFGMGVPGCDNVLSFILHSKGYRVKNPCYSIRCIHLHASDSREYPSRMGNPSVYKQVWPSTINGQVQMQDTPRTRTFRSIKK